MRKVPRLVIAILALGISVSISVFSLVDGVVLRPLPYKDPSRLMALTTVATKPPFEANGSVTYSDFERLRADARSFADIAIMYRGGWSQIKIGDRDQLEPVRGGFVSPNFLSLFGRSPLAGRMFTPDENQGRAKVVLVSESLAERRFGSAALALGKDLQIAGVAWRVVGVMPDDFRVPFADSQLWAPVMSHPQWVDKDEPLAAQKAQRWDLIARLRPGISRDSAQAEVDSIYGQLEKLDPDSHADRALVVPLRDHFTGRVKKPFAILSAAVAFLLLITVANAANLLLARAATRQREFAIRAALGAGTARLVHQSIEETMKLCAIAGVLAIALAPAFVRLLKLLAPPNTPRIDEVGIDTTVFVFAAALSVALGLILGLASVIGNLRKHYSGLLGAAGRSATISREGSALKNVLVASEFALAMTLLTGAVLLVRSFVAVLGVDLGIRSDHILTVQVALPDTVTAPQQSGFYRAAFEKIRSLPGVEAAGAASWVFQVGIERTHALRIVEGEPPEPVDRWQMLEWAQVTGGYFQALGVPLMSGRVFDQRDGPAAPPVVIVNETAARRYWPGKDPIGRRLKGNDPRGPNGGKNDDWLTVVGVVKDIRAGGRERKPFSQIYEPQAQRGETTNRLIVRVSGDPAQATAAVRDAIREVNPGVKVMSAITMERVLDAQQEERRFQTWLIGVFSAVALLLAALGVFAVMHLAVSAKTRELGIRIAVGARAWNIYALVICDGAKLAFWGIAAGSILSMWATSALAGMLFEVKPTDPISFAGAAAILLTVAIGACYLPARRAGKLDPVAALHED
jgi:predicted permease